MSKPSGMKLTQHVLCDSVEAKDVTTTSIASFDDVTRERLKLEVPDEIRYVRQGVLDLHCDLVHSLESLHVVDECGIRHEHT
jgi:hypothetical protein